MIATTLRASHENLTDQFLQYHANTTRPPYLVISCQKSNLSDLHIFLPRSYKPNNLQVHGSNHRYGENCVMIRIYNAPLLSARL